MTNEKNWPKVAVVGAGAVGGYFGGLLARSGVPVTMSFVADLTGSFDIEIESTGTQVGTLEVDPR